MPKKSAVNRKIVRELQEAFDLLGADRALVADVQVARRYPCPKR